MALRGRRSDMNLKGSRSKKKKMVDNRDWRPWSELPEASFDQIKKSLGAIDYLMFGCVCRRWRLYAVAHRQEFMMSQPPLVVFLSDHAQRACYFYSIFDQRLYKATLPNLVGKSFSGLTCGYMIMKDKKERKDSQIWLLNPFTRHELRFPGHLRHRHYRTFILASLAAPSREFVIVAIGPDLQFCRSTDANWTVHDLNDTFFSSYTDRSRQWWFEDGVVFKGKIYVLTNLGEIGVLSLNSQPYVTLLEVKSIGYRNPEIQLLAFDDKLLMIHRIGSYKWEFEVYELNFVKMKWMKMQKLKDEALFLSLKTSGFSKVTKWRGGQQPMNCIYNLCLKDEYTLQFLDSNFSNFPESFPLMKEDCDTYLASKLEVPRCRISLPDTALDVPSWYFPNLSCNVDALSLITP